jgi:adenine deaminase
VIERIANLVDIENRRIRPSRITIDGGRIASIDPIGAASIDPIGADPSLPYALPGFIDAHVHIESSMLVPTEFARLAVVHGTVATVSDPHEIANVLGIAGVDFMIENGRKVPFKFFFGAPSCVPATSFETAGATIDADQIAQLLARDEVLYLAEMMNYPGVLGGDSEVMAKIHHAIAAGKPIDGHGPGLMGDAAARYVAAGISTDHECVTIEEATGKAELGMKILIREGSAAKNFDALFPLIDRYPGRVMFCSDDKHPDDLLHGHIDLLVRRALAGGADLFHILAAACVTPVRHYRLPVGLLGVGEAADFQIVDNLSDFRNRETFIGGICVSSNATTRIDSVDCETINHFDCEPKSASEFAITHAAANGSESTGQSQTARTRVIRAIDRSLVTGEQAADLPVVDGKVVSSPREDILKLTVVNRYRSAPPAVAFIHGFGLRRGAIASSVGHDSHNILAVGVDDESICRAVNLVIACRGGIVAIDGDTEHVLPLPIAGLMTDQDGQVVASDYQRIDQFVKTELGSPLTAPFTTLSFMALLVIPSLKLSDLGLFDCQTFSLVKP